MVHCPLLESVHFVVRQQIHPPPSPGRTFARPRQTILYTALRCAKNQWQDVANDWERVKARTRRMTKTQSWWYFPQRDNCCWECLTVVVAAACGVFFCDVWPRSKRQSCSMEQQQKQGRMLGGTLGSAAAVVMVDSWVKTQCCRAWYPSLVEHYGYGLFQSLNP
jgi:hypothetical protein